MSKGTILITGLLFLVRIHALASGGGGDLKIGYIYMDEEGNRSVSYPSFNYYEGASFSLEGVNYRLKDGTKLSMDLCNVNLDNRNVRLGVNKAGLYGIDFSTNRYRRIYDFDGHAQTKRDRSLVRAWFSPLKYIRMFAKGHFSSVSGSKEVMFGSVADPFARSVDYRSSKFTIGGDIKHQGRLLHAEYGYWDYKDDIDGDNDQLRNTVRLNGMLPLPRYERIILSGAFSRFETERVETDRQIESWSVTGGALYQFLENARFNYIAKLNRAGSSDDFVETDNLTHSLYLSYSVPRLFGATAGYQYHVNDDFEDAVVASSFYFGGWVAPSDKVTFRFEQGFRAEKVDDGMRLVGDEERNRTKICGAYRDSKRVALKVGFELKSRENDELGTSADFSRVYLEPRIVCSDLLTLAGGYSISEGEYVNTINRFEFRSQQVYANLDVTACERLTGGFGIDYFRNERDLDSEAANLLFRASINVTRTEKVELIYRVHNFDDFLFVDRYYTGNILEFSLIKSFSVR